MKKFILLTASLLCSLSWISASGSESTTVKVQFGEEATLRCSRPSKNDGPLFWFRLNQTKKPTCISTMLKTVTYCDGFNNGNFETTVDSSIASLTIKQVNSSDSGQYFCGFYESGIYSFCVTSLNVTDSSEPHDDEENSCEMSDGITQPMNYILAGLTVLLVLVIIGMVVKIRRLQTANKEERNQEQGENAASDEVNYAAVTFRMAKAKRREPEQNVIYASTR